MASIKGVTLKGLTRFIGMEGEAYQGNIYLNNKKVGWFSQSGSGGCSDVDYDSPEVKKEITAIVEQYFKENPPNCDWAGTDEFFFEDLVSLLLDEKDFKKAVKKGYAGYAIVSNVFIPDAEPRPYKVPMAYSLPPNFVSDAVAMEGFFKEMKEKGYDKIVVYKSLNDFIK